MVRRPRVLFLAFYFPPLRCVASVRGANIAKYLSRSGWDVSVATPNPNLWQSPDEPERVVAEIAAWNVRMIYTGHRWRCLSSGFLKRSYRHGLKWFLEGIPRKLGRIMGVDEMAGWYPELEHACAKLRPGDVDVILVTGSPFGAFGVAQRIGQRLQCPYVLDYRDPWTGRNPSNENPRTLSASQDRCRRLEQRLLTGCAAVSVVSPSWAQYLSRALRRGRKSRHDPQRLRSGGFRWRRTGEVRPFRHRVHRAISAAQKQCRPADAGLATAGRVGAGQAVAIPLLRPQ